MREFNSLHNDFKHIKFSAPIQKSKTLLQISKRCYYYLRSQLPFQKASTYPKMLSPQRLKSKSELQFFHIHLHLAVPTKQIQVTTSSLGDLLASTQLEGDEATTVPLTFQGSYDFYFPKMVWCYSQHIKSKFTCIAFINRLGNKIAHSPTQT